MYATLFSTVIAPNGQVLAHLPQPIQAAVQAFLATPPLSLLIHETNTLRDLGPLFLNSITPLGQAFTQAPQAVHFSSSTTGSPVAGSIEIAPKLQAFVQSPLPRQPYLQPVSPG